ncbi:MAG: hypothetical protein K2X35_04275 [Bryobacteraceae bacterium]|nr:hypothetical protein [Bryobacteraceae bacterium]
MDLRKAIGYFFLLLGAALLAAGISGGYSAPLTQAPVNLYSGAAMAMFGGVMAALAARR